MRLVDAVIGCADVDGGGAGDRDAGIALEAVIARFRYRQDTGDHGELARLIDPFVAACYGYAASGDRYGPIGAQAVVDGAGQDEGAAGDVHHALGGVVRIVGVELAEAVLIRRHGHAAAGDLYHIVGLDPLDGIGVGDTCTGGIRDGDRSAEDPDVVCRINAVIVRGDRDARGGFRRPYDDVPLVDGLFGGCVVLGLDAVALGRVERHGPAVDRHAVVPLEGVVDAGDGKCQVLDVQVGGAAYAVVVRRDDVEGPPALDVEIAPGADACDLVRAGGRGGPGVVDGLYGPCRHGYGGVLDAGEHDGC